MEYPKISIVTPSYNQAHFLEQTILSVLGQNYPNLEYIIMDGGSTDGSVDIIKKYDKIISYWISEPDDGQADAISKGFSKSSGTILGWINSDDYYLPGTLFLTAKNLDSNKHQLFIGNCIRYYQDLNKLKTTNVDQFSFDQIIYNDFIVQPSSFWTRLAYEKSMLRTDFHYAFDWDFFIRLYNNDTDLIKTTEYLSVYRFHKDHKTGNGDKARNDEIIKIYQSVLNEHEYKYLLRYLQFKSSIRKFSKAVNYLGSIKYILFKMFFPGIFMNNNRKLLGHFNQMLS